MKSSKNIEMQTQIELGRVFLSAGASALVDKKQLTPKSYLWMHQRGYWGFVREHDRISNVRSMKRQKGRVFSAYCAGKSNRKIWVITDFSKSTTTMMLPEEY